MAGKRHLKVDWPACKAHGVCAELLPELVRLDEWGYPIIAGDPDGAVPRALLNHAQRAVMACPTFALSLIDSTGQPSPPTQAIGVLSPESGAIARTRPSSAQTLGQDGTGESGRRRRH